jgi:hypothetical protein
MDSSGQPEQNGALPQKPEFQIIAKKKKRLIESTKYKVSNTLRAAVI